MTPEALLTAGAQDGTFPAAQAVVLHDGREVLNLTAGGARPDDLFDLASLTKVMCTTALFMRLWGQGKVGPLTRAGEHSLEDLLTHRSGLPAFVPYFVDALRAHPELLDADCPPNVRAMVRRAVLARVFVTPARALTTQPEAVYSDTGFIWLAEELADIAGAPLDEAYDALVAQPLGLRAKFHRLSALPDALRNPKTSNAQPTGRTRPREPAPGQEGMWQDVPSAPSRPGEVDDDNCFVLDGVSGHAGLFGTAGDVARFGQAVLEELQGADRLAHAVLWERALRRDVHTPGSSRAYGFDTPTKPSSAGRFIGDAAPGAFGHLGFTGTSLWVDRARKLVVALCTNRTYNGRGNLRIRELRPRFHDAVVAHLGLERAPLE